MTTRLRGMLAAVHSPFHADGSLHLAMVERQAEFLVQQRVSGVFVCGSTGEAFSLTIAERQQLAERWLACAGRTFPVVVHVGHHCLADARTLAAHAEKMGAYAIAAVPPSYFRPETVADVVAWCRQVAAAAPGTPFYYYHIPFYTGVNISVADFFQQASSSIPTLRGVKFTHSDLIDCGNCLMIDDGRWEIVFGSERMLLSALVLGCQAAIGTTFNYLAPWFHPVLDAFGRGDLEEARQSLHSARQLITRLHPTNVLAASKGLMGFLGVDCGPVRPPLRPLTAGELITLRDNWEAVRMPRS